MTPTWIYTLSLHDALPILEVHRRHVDRNLRRYGDGLKPRERVGKLHRRRVGRVLLLLRCEQYHPRDRKSTRLNSSHTVISYAVFCLKKKILAQSTQTP